MIQNMYVVLMLFYAAFPSSNENATKYSCLPCGRTCDAAIYDHAGKCADCGMELVDASTIRFKTVTFPQICDRIKSNSGVVLLDVRSPQEFNDTAQRNSYGRFQKAININITEIPNRIGELEKYKDKEVIVYCSHSHRSPEVSYYLSTHGFTNVSNVAGGVSTFAQSGAGDCLKEEFVQFPVRK